MKRLSIIILFASLSYGLNAFQLGTMKILSSKTEPFSAEILISNGDSSDIEKITLENFEGGFAKRKNLIDPLNLKTQTVLKEDGVKIISLSSKSPLSSIYFDFLVKIKIRDKYISKRYFGLIPSEVVQKNLVFTKPKKIDQDDSTNFAIQDLGSCSEIIDPQERLNCFDRSLGVDSSSQLPKTNKRVLSQKELTEEFFGKSRQDLEETIERRQNFEIPDRLSSVITKVKRYNTDRYIITLSNGQIWKLLEPSPKQLFKENKEIKIEKGLLGSFQISVEGNNRKYKAKREK